MLRFFSFQVRFLLFLVRDYFCTFPGVYCWARLIASIVSCSCLRTLGFEVLMGPGMSVE